MRHRRTLQRTLALAASLFGLVTIVAGVRVLLGSDPGYIIFLPLLIYNTVMGMAYVIGGIIAWRNIERGKHAAAVILVLNCVVLGLIGFLYVAGSPVAVESLRAMTLRTVVWLALFLGFAWLGRKNAVSGRRDA